MTMAVFGGAGGGGYGRAVTFNGSTYLRKSSDFSTSVDSKKLTMSFWFYKTTTDSDYIYEGEDGFYIELDTNRRINFAGTNTSGTVILSASSTSAANFNLNTWNHLAISVDLSDTGKRHVYLNGSTVATTWTTYTNDTMNLTCSSHVVGAAANLSEIYTGNLAEVYLNFDTYLDLSDSAVLQKFRTSGGKPAFLGTSGNIPTSTTPVLYLSGTATTFATNKGSGGGMTTTGTLTDASTSPID